MPRVYGTFRVQGLGFRVDCCAPSENDNVTQDEGAVL